LRAQAMAEQFMPITAGNARKVPVPWNMLPFPIAASTSRYAITRGMEEAIRDSNPERMAMFVQLAVDNNMSLEDINRMKSTAMGNIKRDRKPK